MASFFKRVVDKGSDIVKPAVRKTANVVQVAAPIAGGLLFGPVGALIGTGVSVAAGQVGPTKNKALEAKRSVQIGAASFSFATLASALGGGGATTGILQNLFGSRSAGVDAKGQPVSDAPAGKVWDPARGEWVDANPPTPFPGESFADFLLRAGKKLNDGVTNPTGPTTGQQTDANGNPIDPSTGATASAAGGARLLVFGGLAVGAYLLLRKKRKAA